MLIRPGPCLLERFQGGREHSLPAKDRYWEDLRTRLRLAIRSSWCHFIYPRVFVSVLAVAYSTRRERAESCYLVVWCLRRPLELHLAVVQDQSRLQHPPANHRPRQHLTPPAPPASEPDHSPSILRLPWPSPQRGSVKSHLLHYWPYPTSKCQWPPPIWTSTSPLPGAGTRIRPPVPILAL